MCSYEGDEGTAGKAIEASTDGAATQNELTNATTDLGSIKQDTSAANGSHSVRDSDQFVYGDNIYGNDNNDNNELGNNAEDRPVPVVTGNGFAGTVGIKEDG